MVAGFWTLDLTTITGQSAFILRHHTAAVSSYDCTFDDLELVHQSLRTLERPHTHKFPRVNAQDFKLGPIQPWDVKDFLRPGRGRAVCPDVVVELVPLSAYDELAAVHAPKAGPVRDGGVA